MKKLFTLFFIASLAASVSKAQAPDFSFTDINGDTHTLSDALADGKVIILDFFFVNCGPCNTWAPEIDQIVADYENTTVEVWAISDRDSDAAIASSIFNPTHSNHLVGGVDGGGDDVVNLYAQNYSFLGFPTYSVICGDGSITWDVWPITTGVDEIRDLLTPACGVSALTTSVSTIAGMSDVTVMPNPAVDMATVQFSLESQENLAIRVSNALGQVVQEIPAQQYASGTQNLSLDVSGMSAGQYFVSLVSDNGINTLRLAVQ